MKSFSLVLFLSLFSSLYAKDFNYFVETGLGIKGGKTQEYVLNYPALERAEIHSSSILTYTDRACKTSSLVLKPVNAEA
jgi:hypothetical protein